MTAKSSQFQALLRYVYLFIIKPCANILMIASTVYTARKTYLKYDIILDVDFLYIGDKSNSYKPNSTSQQHENI